MIGRNAMGRPRSAAADHSERVGDRRRIGRRWSERMAREAGLGEFDDMLVTIGERPIDQRIGILVSSTAISLMTPVPCRSRRKARSPPASRSAAAAARSHPRHAARYCRARCIAVTPWMKTIAVSGCRPHWRDRCGRTVRPARASSPSVSPSRSTSPIAGAKSGNVGQPLERRGDVAGTPPRRAARRAPLRSPRAASARHWRDCRPSGSSL